MNSLQYDIMLPVCSKHDVQAQFSSMHAKKSLCLTTCTQYRLQHSVWAVGGPIPEKLIYTHSLFDSHWSSWETYQCRNCGFIWPACSCGSSTHQLYHTHQRLQIYNFPCKYRFLFGSEESLFLNIELLIPNPSNFHCLYWKCLVGHKEFITLLLWTLCVKTLRFMSTKILYLHYIIRWPEIEP